MLMGIQKMIPSNQTAYTKHMCSQPDCNRVAEVMLKGTGVRALCLCLRCYRKHYLGQPVIKLQAAVGPSEFKREGVKYG